MESHKNLKVIKSMNDKVVPLVSGENIPPDSDAFPAVRVINLERSATRWDSISGSLESAGIKNFARLNAVDALRLTEDEIDLAYSADMNRRYYFSPLKPSEIACFLSHREAWRMLIEENLDGAFILEDDVILRPGGAQTMCEIAYHANSSVPLVVKIFSKRLARGKTTKVGQQTRLVEPILPPLGTQGAYVNKAAAEILLLSSEKFHDPVDVFLQKTWKHGVRIQVLATNAVDEVSNHLGGSTLTSNKPRMSSRIRREVTRPIFRVSMYLRALWEIVVRR